MPLTLAARATLPRMRIAAFSDIHGNLTALDAVLAAARQERVDEMWIVGDLVALGPEPAETARLLRRLPRTHIVRGNTDRYVTTGDLPPVLRLQSGAHSGDLEPLLDTVAAHAWTRGCITATGSYQWLANLPLEIRLLLPDQTRVLLVHASPGTDDGAGITDEMSDSDLIGVGCSTADADLIVVGHTHRPLDRYLGSTRIINLGSVSLPATTETSAMWTLIDASNTGYTIERRTIDYDFEEVTQALINSNHPSADYLRTRLRTV